MADMKEKLIKLLREVQYLGGLEEKIADHLIANGATIPVRCKDCKYRTLGFFGGHCCRLHKGLAMVIDESYCSFGERRTDERTD